MGNQEHVPEFVTVKLNKRRIMSNCAIIPGTKNVMITGGMGGFLGREGLESTEIFDAENESITMGSPLNSEILLRKN